MFSSLGRERGLRCTKRSCIAILFCWLKAGHPQEQVCVDLGTCQMPHSEKDMTILQDKFYGYLASWLLPPFSQDLTFVSKQLPSLLMNFPHKRGSQLIADIMVFLWFQELHLTASEELSYSIEPKYVLYQFFISTGVKAYWLSSGSLD